MQVPAGSLTRKASGQRIPAGVLGKHTRVVWLIGLPSPHERATDLQSAGNARAPNSVEAGAGLPPGTLAAFRLLAHAEPCLSSILQQPAAAFTVDVFTGATLAGQHDAH